MPSKLLNYSRDSGLQVADIVVESSRGRQDVVFVTTMLKFVL